MAWTKILLSGDAVTELSGTAYRMLIVDSAGDVIEVAHGTANKVWTAQGAAADPTWEDAAAGAHALDAGQTDVTITTPADDEILSYETGSWINKTAAEAGLATAAHEGEHEVGGGDELVDGVTAPTSVGTTPSSGTDTKPPRMDHVHDLGAGAIDDSALFAVDVVDAAAIDDAATDIQFKQIILEPVASGTGTVEGTVAYLSGDDHVYVYVA